MGHPYGKSYPPDYEYSGHASRMVVIHLHTIERQLRQEIASEVRHLSQAEITALWPDGYPAERLKLAHQSSPLKMQTL